MEFPPKEEADSLRSEVAALRDQLEHLALQPYSALVASVLCTSLSEVERSWPKSVKNGRVPQNNLRRRLGYDWRCSPLLLFCFSLLFFVSVSKELGSPMRMFNLCGASQSGHFVSVPSRVRCIPPAPAKISEVLALLYVPRSLPGQIPAFKCSTRKRTICTRTGILGSLGGQGIVSDNIVVSVMAPEICQAAVATRQVFFDRRAFQLIQAIPDPCGRSGAIRAVPSAGIA